MMEQLVIIGGGVAGLSCLNALLDRHISPLLLEASTVGSPKICGEFLAPPAMPALEQWGIGPMQTIKQVCMHAHANALNISFPRPAGAYARHQAEIELATRARAMGGRIIEQAPIQSITPATDRDPYTLHLMSGDVIQSREVIFATGKFSKTMANPSAAAYVGFKIHIQQIIQPETLLMFSLADGYLGIVPISAETSNLTCLVQRRVIDRAGSCKAYLNRLMSQGSGLHDGLTLPDLETLDWLEGAAPAFGPKRRPNWPHAFWIGDALASFHPAIGYGFAHSVNSATLAADYYLQQDPIGYHEAIKRLTRPKRVVSQSMHRLLQKPRLCSVMSPLVGNNRWISQLLLNKLDY